MSKSKKTFPKIVKVGHTIVKIYHTLSRGRDLYTVAHYLGDKRIRQNFSDLDLATTAATTIATKLSEGELKVLELTNEARLAYVRAVQALEGTGVSLEMAADKGAWGQVMWVSSDVSGMQSVRFPLRPDGKFHRYDLDVSAQPAWRGDALLLGLSPSEEPGATATIRSLSLATSAQGPPETDRTEPGAGNPNN